MTCRPGSLITNRFTTHPPLGLSPLSNSKTPLPRISTHPLSLPSRYRIPSVKRDPQSPHISNPFIFLHCESLKFIDKARRLLLLLLCESRSGADKVKNNGTQVRFRYLFLLILCDSLNPLMCIVIARSLHSLTLRFPTRCDFPISIP
ncbi:hypothetical protein I3843_01G167500 [Carya illinoinensis]|uniref:Uncharacterized protein n=1 Tax=Carya illinoinensis TaxID=32201 RepID=A0A922K511_CARIL|nr:hypothetical protein I3842_01G175200 [Carya illinoinensis]KAG6732397.1 hypothetical protein I3842_01G175200 [Carya illinoinensis]KAG7996582.1 hypothetical protein I3843_01G167500 [Carya illinoinensis]